MLPFIYRETLRVERSRVAYFNPDASRCVKLKSGRRLLGPVFSSINHHAPHSHQTITTTRSSFSSPFHSCSFAYTNLHATPSIRGNERMIHNTYLKYECKCDSCYKQYMCIYIYMYIRSIEISNRAEISSDAKISMERERKEVETDVDYYAV